MTNFQPFFCTIDPLEYDAEQMYVLLEGAFNCLKAAVESGENVREYATDMYVGFMVARWVPNMTEADHQRISNLKEAHSLFIHENFEELMAGLDE